MPAANLGTAYITVSPKFDNLTGSVDKALGGVDGTKAGTRLGQAMGNATSSGFLKGGAIIGVASAMAGKAINAVTSSLGSAISRVDTLNNYPKVMQSLGYSAQEADASISQMGTHLDGLPTSLDSMVGFVQQLSATTGDLGEATKVGLAFNDMILAGGANTVEASSAMTQYNQMLAVGKVDQQAWNSVVRAAPGQIDEVAKSLLGADANQRSLYKALQDGTVTFDDFNEAIVKLDEEGGDGFQSFEEQARSSTQGIGTAIDNVRNRITRAVGDIIQAIGAENIAGVINGISSHFKDIAKPFVDAINGFKETLDVEGFKEAFGEIQTAVTTAFGGDAADMAANFGRNVGTMVNGLIPILKDLAPIIGALAQAVRNLLQFASDNPAAFLAIVGGIKGLMIAKDVVKPVSDVADAVGPLADKAGDAAGKLPGLSTETGKLGTSAGGAWKNLLSMGAAVLMIGGGVALAALGIKLIADAAIALAAAGWPAIAVLIGLAGALVGIGVAVASAGTAMTVGAVGCLAFGAALALIGVGVLAATAGISMLAGQLPTIAAYGGQAAVALVQMAGGLIALAAGAIAAGVSALVAVVGITALGAVMALSAIGVGAFGLAFGGVAGQMQQFATGSQVALASMTAMQGACDGMKAALAGIMGIALGAAATFGTIASVGESAFNSIRSAAIAAFAGLASAASAGMAGALAQISIGLALIQARLSSARLTIPAPKVEALPHFNWRGSLDASTGAVPTLDVSYYARGGFFPRAAILGEADPEYAIPLNDRTLSPLAQGIADRTPGGGGKVWNVYIDGATVNSSAQIEDDFYRLMQDLNRLHVMNGGR